MEKKKNILVVIILDCTLEPTLLDFFNSVGQDTYYTNLASISGGREENPGIFFNPKSFQWATSEIDHVTTELPLGLKK